MALAFLLLLWGGAASAHETRSTVMLLDISDARVAVEAQLPLDQLVLGITRSFEEAALPYVQAHPEDVRRYVESNLPTGFVARNGLKFADMSADQQANALAVARAVLTDAGYEDFQGVRAADDYLASQGGGSEYSSGKYYIAVFGTPSTTGNWMLQMGGHHRAYNVTYLAGSGYPVPNKLGAETKTTFTLNSETYGPVVGEGQAMVAVFNGLST